MPIVIEPDPSVRQGDRVVEELKRRLGVLEGRVAELAAVVEGYGSELKGVGEAVASVSERLGELQVFYQVVSLIGQWKMTSCANCSNGVCMLWRIRGEAGPLSRHVVEDDNGVRRVRVAEAPWFCGVCPFYRGVSD